MILPPDLRKKIENLGIDPDQSRYQLLRDINDRELEIGYDENWEMTARGREVERIYDAVYRLKEMP